MEHTVTAIEYAVGLSREEYIYSQQLVSKVQRGRRALGSWWFSVLLMIPCVLAVFADRQLSGQWDPALIAIVAMMVVAEVWVLLATPYQLRRQHGRAYDKTCFHGYSFDGVVTVGERSITKKAAKGTTQIPYAACVAFIEDPEMILFGVGKGKSIVIPKRCLTAEDAEATRKAALAAIPPSRCYLLGRVDAELSSRLPLPEEGVPAPEDPLMLMRVEYTPRELKSQATETAIRNFGEMLPQRMLTAVLIVIVSYFVADIPPLPTFLLCAVVIFLLAIMGARTRVQRALTLSQGEARFVTVELTERLIRIGNKGAEKLQVPWSYVTRAVEAPCEVEIYVSGDKAFTIPKRCIEDMEQLRRIVDAHLPA